MTTSPSTHAPSVAFAVVAAALCLSDAPAAAQNRATAVDTQKMRVSVETVASGLSHPWGLAFIDGGRMLVTERAGRLRVVSPDGRVSPPVSGLPAIDDGGQGGLLDVVTGPNFASDRMIYWSFSEGRSEGGKGTSVARGRLSPDGTRVDDAAVIFRQQPAVRSSMHFGSRLVFDRTGALFVTLGDRFTQRASAQDPATHIGKVVRVMPDGSIPRDNPFATGSGARAEIWSIGHRNVQAAALHPVTGKLWTVEHGARGGDEVNIPGKGLNYGWPVITYGVEYTGGRIGEGTRKEGLEQPIFYWDPSVAPSGAAFVTSGAFPAWNGNLLVGALAGQALVRLELDGERVTREERMLSGLNARIRDVRQGPDGFIYLLTDADDGRLLRLRPAR
jgi:glucose/arabinose dehydrogenase